MPRKERPAASADLKVFVAGGYEILVGQSARDNDRLTFEVAAPQDLWLHVGGGTPGSHVVVRNPGGGEVPREVVKRAAELAVYHSKAREAKGKVEVHLCRACDVRKPRGARPGSVELRRWEGVRVYPPETV
jgi:predicted ribosome quality control (RQC) complex YloA/Tae2 family protein